MASGRDDEPRPRDPKEYKIATKLAHAKTSTTDPYGASSPPLYQTATFAQPSATENGPYDYTRSGNDPDAVGGADGGARETLTGRSLRQDVGVDVRHSVGERGRAHRDGR